MSKGTCSDENVKKREEKEKQREITSTHKCDECGKSYVQKSHLTHHKNEKHSK